MLLIKVVRDPSRPHLLADHRLPLTDGPVGVNYIHI
jgi:hypothetical protein